MQIKEMPEDYALVLQQVDEMGTEDLAAIGESLALDRARLMHIIYSLKNKGLVRIIYTPHDMWVSISAKGRRLIGAIWPEARMRHSL